MSVGTFAMSVVLVLLVALPVVSAVLAHQLFIADIALPFVPAAVFVATLLVFNAPARTGWALAVYPVVVVVVSVVGLYVRVYLFRRVRSPRVAATATLVAFAGAAALFGSTVAPLYE